MRSSVFVVFSSNICFVRLDGIFLNVLVSKTVVSRLMFLLLHYYYV